MSKIFQIICVANPLSLLDKFLTFQKKLHSKKKSFILSLTRFFGFDVIAPTSFMWVKKVNKKFRLAAVPATALLALMTG
jgi:hypothetical protein